MIPVDAHSKYLVRLCFTELITINKPKAYDISKSVIYISLLNSENKSHKITPTFYNLKKYDPLLFKEIIKMAVELINKTNKNEWRCLIAACMRYLKK